MRRDARRSLLLGAISVSMLHAACSGSTVQRLHHHEIPSAALAKTMAYEVWTPLDLGPEERLPLLVFLHGGGDSENSFDQHEVGQHLDRQLAAGRIPRAVIVVPNGELGFWENWHDGSRRYRDWVVNEVIPAVRAEYHTAPCPEGCHIGGVSMGGHGTMRMVWFHPETFASAACLSGPILDSEAILDFTDSFIIKIFVPVEDIWGPMDDLERIHSEDLYRQWTSPEDLRGLRLMVGVAQEDRDDIISINRKFHRHLETHGIEHAYLEFPGGHKWTSWTPVIDKVLRFAVWGAMDAEGPAPSLAASTSSASSSPGVVTTSP